MFHIYNSGFVLKFLSSHHPPYCHICFWSVLGAGEFPAVEDAHRVSRRLAPALSFPPTYPRMSGRQERAMGTFFK